LRQLDEGRPHPLHVGRQLLQLLGRDLHVGLRALDGLFEPGAADEVGAAVPHQQQRHVLVALKVFGPERESHMKE
jgi:hypothetical protein